MIALVIAIVALAGAGYAVFVVRRTEAAVLELIEAQQVEGELEVEEGGDGEAWLSEGDFYIPDVVVFMEKVNAIALYHYDGVPQAVIPGQGVVSLHKLLSETSRPRAVR